MMHISQGNTFRFSILFTLLKQIIYMFPHIVQALRKFFEYLQTFENNANIAAESMHFLEMGH